MIIIFTFTIIRTSATWFSSVRQKCRDYILSATNNNGFWTGWLELLIPSCTISLYHNQLQQHTINDCLRLAPFSFLFSLSVSSLPSNGYMRTTQKTPLNLLLYLQHTAQQWKLSDCCLRIHCLILLYALPGNGLFTKNVSTGMCISSRCLAVGRYVTI
jgi:hypothetical protein